MKIRFIIEKIEKKKADLSTGTLYFMNDLGEEILRYPAVSGGWGRGMLEVGNYVIRHASGPKEIASIKEKDAYSLFGFGWFASLVPLFETIRDNLGLHPDGHVPGTLGCVGVIFKTLNENIYCWNTIRSALDHGEIEFEVIQQLGRVS